VSIYPNTLFVGKVLRILPQVDSTQTFLMNLYANSSPIEGSVILSYNQENGYGQRNSSWESMEGQNIALSCLFLPAFLAAQKHFYLSMAVALAVKTTVRNLTGKSTSIKWPNDIMVNHSKIAGILIETQLRQNNIQRAYSGIGLNVNQTSFGLLQWKATSLELCTKHHFDLDNVSQILMEWLEKYYLLLKAGKYDLILNEYNNALYKRNQRISLQHINGDISESILKGVSPDGKVQILHNNVEEEYIHGMVRILYDR
jgi:BirA family biotin operon repressor/biotin-[acetyl-CoA-carboxylase] ligase